MAGAAGRYDFAVGELRCIAFADATAKVPVESIVTDVPLEQWQQALREHGLPTTEVTTYNNCLYVETGQNNVLVDTGWGRGTQRRDGALVERLLAAGVAPSDVDIVIMTHFDPDHAGGLVTAEGELTFANADYVLSDEAWAFWSDAARVAQLPEMRTAAARRALPLIANRLEVADTGAEFLPGFRLIAAPGHRPGHTALAMESAGERLYHLGDAVGNAVLLEHPGWHWSFDGDPQQAEQTRRALLGRAAEEQALVFGSHLPFPGVGRVSPWGDGWRWQPLGGTAG